jgi:sugar phosphate isomerase/epimerase
MPVELRPLVKQMLKEKGIRISSYGVVGLSGDEAQCRKVFDFARDFDIGTINSEPKEADLDMIEVLCREYGIKLGLHNHPKPSHYWDPNVVLAACAGRSHWIGACADTGHWVRSGLDPLACLRKLRGRVSSVHLKEVDKTEGEDKLHDVIWGQGKGRVPAQLEELHAQGFQGVFAAEYEYHWENNAPEIAGCTAFFNRQAASLQSTGWQPLLAEDLGNMDFKADSWTYEEGVLTWKGGSDLWTKALYGNFILDLEFQTFEKTNSGVFVRAAKPTWLPWPEVQVSESFDQAVDTHICGAIFDVQAPFVNAVKPNGAWNRMTIRMDGPFLQVVLNGQSIIDMNLNDWTEAHKNPDGTKNKFDVAYRDLPRQGMIGLQDHHFPVAYRNIKIKTL